MGVGTAPEKDSGSGESLDLSPPAPNPTLFPVPARAEFQQDLWKSRDHGVIQTWIWLCLGAPSALCSWVSNKSGAQNPRNCCWGSAGIREDLVWGIPVWGIKWGSAWIPVRAHRDWDFLGIQEATGIGRPCKSLCDLHPREGEWHFGKASLPASVPPPHTQIQECFMGKFSLSSS